MEMNEIVQHIREVTEGVCSTMLALEVSPGEPYVERSAPGPTAGVVALVGLAGTWSGTGSVSCSAEVACRLSSQFLMAHFDSVNEEVLDAVAEVANMIIGNLKTVMEETLGPMGLSIPTVIYGWNFTTRSMSQDEWTVVPFHGPDGLRFDVHVCLAPSEKRNILPRPGFTELHKIPN